MVLRVVCQFHREPSARLSKEVCLSERFLEASAGVSPGFRGALRGFHWIFRV